MLGLPSLVRKKIYPVPLTSNLIKKLVGFPTRFGFTLEDLKYNPGIESRSTLSTCFYSCQSPSLVSRFSYSRSRSTGPEFRVETPSSRHTEPRERKWRDTKTKE